VVFGPGKVIKIRIKHFSAVLTGNDKNYTPNSVSVFRVQNQVIVLGFKILLLWWFLGPKKSSKYDQNIFRRIEGK